MDGVNEKWIALQMEKVLEVMDGTRPRKWNWLSKPRPTFYPEHIANHVLFNLVHGSNVVFSSPVPNMDRSKNKKKENKY